MKPADWCPDCGDYPRWKMHLCSRVLTRTKTAEHNPAIRSEWIVDDDGNLSRRVSRG